MTEARSEITLKFNLLPEAEPAANKKVEISLTDQNGITFTALINAKSWRKAEADVAAFSAWGGAVSGKLRQCTDRSFEVVDAGIKVFRRRRRSHRLSPPHLAWMQHQLCKRVLAQMLIT